MFSCVRFALSLAFGLVLASPIYASSSMFSQSIMDSFRHSVDFSVGSRTGDYYWNIASDFSAVKTPNILSELTYSKIEVFEVQLDWEMEKESGAMQGLVMALKLGSGTIQDGVAQDSDYDGDDRTGEFSRSLSQTKGSHTQSIEGHFGWAFYTPSNWRMVPVVGFAYNTQSFIKTDGVQVVSTTAKTLAEGPFEGLNSSYNASWYGPYLGFSLAKIGRKHALELSTKHHMADYYADANWNLRRDFMHPKSFAHWSEGTGSVHQFKYSYRINNDFAVSVNYVMESWKTGAGVDTVYLNDGSAASTQFNEASWEAKTISLGMSWGM